MRKWACVVEIWAVVTVALLAVYLLTATEARYPVQEGFFWASLCVSMLLHQFARYLAVRNQRNAPVLNGFGWLFIGSWLATLGLVVMVAFTPGVSRPGNATPALVGLGVAMVQALIGVFVLRRLRGSARGESADRGASGDSYGSDG